VRGFALLPKSTGIPLPPVVTNARAVQVIRDDVQWDDYLMRALQGTMELLPLNLVVMMWSALANVIVPNDSGAAMSAVYRYHGRYLAAWIIIPQIRFAAPRKITPMSRYIVEIPTRNEEVLRLLSTRLDEQCVALQLGWRSRQVGTALYHNHIPQRDS